MFFVCDITDGQPNIFSSGKCPADVIYGLKINGNGQCRRSLPHQRLQRHCADREGSSNSGGTPATQYFIFLITSAGYFPPLKMIGWPSVISELYTERDDTIMPDRPDGNLQKYFR